MNLVQQMIFLKGLEITNTVQYSNTFETVFKKITHTINDYSFTFKQDGMNVRRLRVKEKS